MTSLRFFLYRALPVSVAALLGLTSCADKKDVAGGTEAESTIALQVHLADGTPASLARVRMLADSYLSDGEKDVEWTLADDDGRVEFKDVAAGSYVVEARRTRDEEAVGAIAYVTKDSAGAVDQSMELTELTTIEGYVSAGQGPSVVRIAGVDRYVVPDSAGHFVIDSLPAGDFGLRIESLSNRGVIEVSASAGSTVPAVSLGEPRGFAVEDFESFSGISATGEILGDGWWYALDKDGKNILPLWDKTLASAYAGKKGCASGGCARTTDRLGFLLGLYDSAYALPSLDTLMFSARGTGKLHVALAYGKVDDESESGLAIDVELSKVWKGYAIALADMKTFGKADKKNFRVTRIDFQVSDGDTLFLDDVFLGGITEKTLKDVATGNSEYTTYPEDWSEHEALLAQADGYAANVTGGKGGVICRVTTMDDFIIVDDSTNVDSLGNVATKAVIAEGSLRDCASRDTAAWILFEKSGVYHLSSPLRIKSNKTFDGRGRDVRLTGTGIMTDVTENVIFENITFSAPSIYEKDSSSRRAVSLHNITNTIWIDHCTFDEYPIYQLDMKRGSYDVTVSWSRFENAETGILFGIEPDLFKETFQTMTMHHNYFSNMTVSGVFARGGMLHAYNNYFNDVGHYGVECTDSARCFIEKNIFNKDEVVSLYRLWEDDSPVDTTVGFVKMTGNWYTAGGKDLIGEANGYKPSYEYVAEEPDAGLAGRIKKNAGPR
ncbi:polysaccharide lyase family 1 protein [Fibrobacter sp. UWEL]|uniref:pectate lyase family protein n=1 Tax=Fibrobacter sp. UWEL TaxID=1896209 RepID=UPI00092284A4|nr:right-handed parallel beta-helix repeat-containing protein [Fibrobacter sp. UWEL]SHK49097.1 Pectate lyase [Fibrobacter sp. UWEL]